MRAPAATRTGLARFLALLCASGVVAGHASPAAAFPDGAPWGSAFPDAREACADCHYDQPLVEAAAAITVAGLPEALSPGEIYELTLTFAPNAEAARGAVVAGFLAGVAVGRAPGGEFLPPDAAAALAREGAEIRSSEVREGFPARWRLKWRAPAGADCEPVILYVAANASNDDASPFGDRVFRRVFTLGDGASRTPIDARRTCRPQTPRRP